MEHVPDYRCGRKTKHVLAEMLVCLVAGYACGRTSVGRALDWCRNHANILRKHIALEHGIASEATMSRMLGGIDEEMFALELMAWAGELLNRQGMHVIIDGKALRGGTEKVKDGAVPYVLNAIDATTQLVLGQYAIREKTNEITAIPNLLELLEMKGNVFTIDAIGTQTKIMGQIVANGGHFVLQVKKNQPTMYDDILTALADLEERAEKEAGCSGNGEQQEQTYSKWNAQEKNRERVEYRECVASKDVSFLECVREGETPYIKSFGCMTQIRVPVEKDMEGMDITVSKKEFLQTGSHRKQKVTEGDGIRDDIQRIGLISDLKLSAVEMAGYKRAHWRIENGLHHVLDDAFREDRCTATRGKNNLAVIRKFAYNLLRLAILRERPGWGIQRMMDYFCDNHKMIEKYVFSSIERFR